MLFQPSYSEGFLQGPTIRRAGARFDVPRKYLDKYGNVVGYVMTLIRNATVENIQQLEDMGIKCSLDEQAC